MEDKLFFYDLDRDQLKEILLSAGEPAYRSEQVWKGVYQNLAKTPDEITALPKSLREKLTAEINFQRLNPVERFASSDGETVKTLFTLPDGARIETVLMHYDERETLCISSQAGCAMGCVFCATGQMGLKRSLTSGEIVEQVMHYARELEAKGRKVTNIVVMGMGEPFHNYDAVMAAINRLNDPTGMNMGARRFTISTVGIIPGLKKFTAQKSQVNLAVSLHAANDSLRNRLIPANRKYPLAELIKASCEYVETTGRRLTFEWALISGVNDTAHDALELAALVKGLNCHVNLIPLNPTAQYPGAPTTSARAQEFKKILDSASVACTIRLRRGIDIQAGCGQLAARHVDGS
jgi:23S rRNA (adenine2503-C2)-methyltransferase